ncbi:tryptophan-rich sensory protein [Calidifontibacter terrae]
MSERLALVTGATGYVGGEVAQELLRRGWRVRLLSRHADAVRDLPWGGLVVPDGEPATPGRAQVVEGDATDPQAVAEALADVDVAWYLLHSMGQGDDFAQAEERMATTFADAARAQQVSRIVFLGGLHPRDEELSEHLASRVAVGKILLDSGVPTAALQAGVVIGAESASFVMMRHLAERLPAIVAPRWVRNRIQPIAVTDAVHYLVAAADLPPDLNRTFDIGGPEALRYGEMISRYARATGRLPRPAFIAPVTTANLGARWIGLVTPVGTELAKPLVGSLLHDTVVQERDLDELVGPPPGGVLPFDEAVRRAAPQDHQHRWVRTLAATTAAVAATALVGGAATDPSSRWYRELRTPSWQPPAVAFPLVWTALYTDIALVSALSLADLAETGRSTERRSYAVALGANLALNAGWSILFFGRHRPTTAAFEAVALAVSSADLVRRSRAVSPEKGAVLAPYALWTGFAAVLTARIGSLNRRR